MRTFFDFRAKFLTTIYQARMMQTTSIIAIDGYLRRDIRCLLFVDDCGRCAFIAWASIWSGVFTSILGLPASGLSVAIGNSWYSLSGETVGDLLWRADFCHILSIQIWCNTRRDVLHELRKHKIANWIAKLSTWLCDAKRVRKEA